MARVIQVHHGQGRETDGQVDEEHPPPTVEAEDGGRTGECTANHRAEDRGDAKDGHEVALVFRAVLQRHNVADNGERQGQQASSAQALDTTGECEFSHGMDGPGKERTRQEDQDRRQIERPTAKDIAQFSI
jgi:hypothetical protein